MKNVICVVLLSSLYLTQAEAVELGSRQHFAADAGSKGPIVVDPLRRAYYGDLHLHTSYSLDAYLVGGTKVDPDVAYRFAKGESITYLGEQIRRRQPLDFMAVTDHAENIGVMAELDDPKSVFSTSEFGKWLGGLLNAATGADGRWHIQGAEWMGLFWGDYAAGRVNKMPAELQAESRAAWSREIDFANRNYSPGKFTTFIAYEWTSQPNAANLHRNVIFRGDSAPYPFSAFDSKEPQKLWDWLDAIRSQGYEALAIPHNGNASNGLMYNWVTEYMDGAYARQRQLNEPLSEISQSKGASETNPLLSPNDEFAGFENFDFLEQFRLQPGRPQGSYLRDALGGGLVLQKLLGANPFKYGFVGGSDLHSGLSVSDQRDFDGSHWTAYMGGGLPTPVQVAASFGRTTTNESELLNLRGTSGNLTGIWAESNTRDALYDALRRRETFATTGTRLQFRFFGGWDLSRNLLQRRDWVSRAYIEGVPMGGDLPARPTSVQAPSFAIAAMKDPDGAPLDRVQIIKVWEAGGKQKEKIYDVAWAGHRKADPATGRIAAIGDTVDPLEGTYDASGGAVELKALWTDPEFDPSRLAAYYLRVLEIPTPRWSTLMALRYHAALPKNVPITVQQRGWSSPIWYEPRT
jgi:hypothetical protein